MALTLGFHIIFACLGVAMPVLMVLAEIAWLRTGRIHFVTLARRWSRGVAVLFAIGAVSGTVLSFELGLLWPRFMLFAGPVIGIPFSIEGLAFFTEAIFIAIYLYGWDRLRPSMHLMSGVIVALSGFGSGVIVTTINAWMNTPAGFRLRGGAIVEIDHVRAIWNPMAIPQGLHMILAAYAATGFAVAGVHACLLHRSPQDAVHRAGLWIALCVGGIASFLQPLSGDILARSVAENQPLKLAAFEALYETEASAPERLAGPILIPYGLSLLAFHDPHAVVKGMNEFPREDWPPVTVVRPAFLVMVAIATALLALTVWAALIALRRRFLHDSSRMVRRWDRASLGRPDVFLRVVSSAAPIGFVAVEAGWIVTEVGRQPWIIHGVLRTKDSVTSAPHLWLTFGAFTAVYAALALGTTVLLLRIIGSFPADHKKGARANVSLAID